MTFVRWRPEFFAGRALAVLGMACGAPERTLSPADVAAAERAALTSVFLTYEHPQQLILWDGAPSDSPILGGTAIADSLAAGGVAPNALALPVPCAAITTPQIDAHFRVNADGWEAWFRRYPGSGGFVEVTAPRPLPGRARSASVVVARLCGEHCRGAWRVIVQKGDDGSWTTSAVAPVSLPRL